jgi:hypothetical protein
MSIYLLDHPPKRKQFNFNRQSSVSGAIVVHTAECAMDISGPDMAAESVARFISTRSDAGSYHSVVDSDSIVRVGRYEWEMFHEGTGGNRWSLGLSFACRAAQWATAPIWWLDGALSNGATEAYNMAAWVKETTNKVVPAKRISTEEYRDGLPGFIAHAQLDPTRRSDPGKDFPWAVFLDKYRRLTEVTDTTKLGQLEAFVSIDWAYRSWLGRTPNENELAYWLSQAEKDGLETVKNSIKNSPEAHGR